METSMPQMIDELRKASTVALFSHISPDGDTLGSMLAVGLALETIGKTVYFCNPDPIPPFLSFLPGANRIQLQPPMPMPQTLLFLDSSDLSRFNLRIEQIPASCMVLNLDHHVSNQKFGHINWIDPKASATGEMALKLIRELGIGLNSDLATNLYSAIVTDTGAFQFSNTTADTHRRAAELIEVGIDIGKIHNLIYNQKPMAQVELLRIGLNQLNLYHEGLVAFMSLNRQDFAKAGAEDSLSEGLVDHARSIQGVEVAVLFKEVESGSVRLSLRSNRWFNVNSVASRFGGGGHQRAAGCTITATIEEAQKLMLKAIVEEMEVGRSHQH